MISTNTIKSHLYYQKSATHYLQSVIRVGSIADFYKKIDGHWHFSTISHGWKRADFLIRYNLIDKLIPIEKSIEQRLLEAF